MLYFENSGRAEVEQDCKVRSDVEEETIVNVQHIPETVSSKTFPNYYTKLKKSSCDETRYVPVYTHVSLCVCITSARLVCECSWLLQFPAIASQFIRGRIHEGPSRYRDHKANRPDSYGPLACSEEAVFMKAGQQGPQLSARVFLNHDLVTDCACVLKGMCNFSTR